MVLLALTLTLATLHAPQASSVHLDVAYSDAPLVSSPDAKSARLLEIDDELSHLKRGWPTGSAVLMTVGFAGGGSFGLAGFLVGVAVGSLPGVFILVVGLVTGGLLLMMGVAGLIWGAVQLGADAARSRELNDERDLLLHGEAARVSAAALPPTLITVATF